MKFYKLKLKVGHQGVKRFREMDFVCCANNCLDAIEITRKLPMVKHTSTKVVSSAKEVDEIEFIVTLVQNNYKLLMENEIDVNPLRNVCKRSKDLHRYGVSDEAKRLVQICNDYQNAEESDKAKIEAEYRTFALDIIDKHKNDQGFDF